ncbi:hypothetical protein ACFRQM_09600 [Streptomyces sp. NPDC056831]|uniref:hypothetical protein n=1 Tax=Streptomyces sp. NPDC056831 TaxID=3345954 RepID=UPI0036D1EB97
MGVRDLCVAVAEVLLYAVITTSVWGAVLLSLLGLAAVATWRRLRPTGSHRDGRTRTPARTAVRAGVRTLADTGPDPAATTALTCADTSPDVSTDTCPGLSGHDEEGER